MDKEKSIKFANLLKKRKQLSKANKNNTKTVSSNDPQLIDTLKNFNESKEYKLLRKM